MQNALLSWLMMELLGDFSVWSLLGGFVFGTIGIWLLRLGKRNTNFWHFGIGVVLLVYPYFVSQVVAMWLIGIGLLYVAYLNRN